MVRVGITLGRHEYRARLPRTHHGGQGVSELPFVAAEIAVREVEFQHLLGGQAEELRGRRQLIATDCSHRIGVPVHLSQAPVGGHDHKDVASPDQRSGQRRSAPERLIVRMGSKHE